MSKSLCGWKTHEDVSVPVGFDPVRQAGEISIREQFAPALEIERGLSFGGMEVDRQRHWEKVIPKS